MTDDPTIMTHHYFDAGHERAVANIAHRVFDQTQKLSFVSRPILSVQRPPRGPAAEVTDTGRVR